MKYYYVYKTVHVSSGKFYIGKHSTKNLDDKYLGSGDLIRAALKKYPFEEFEQEILWWCHSEEIAKKYEKIEVNKFLGDERCWNLVPGGGGSWPISSHRLWSDEAKSFQQRVLKGVWERQDLRNRASKVSLQYWSRDGSKGRQSEIAKKRNKEYWSKQENRDLQSKKRREFLSNEYNRKLLSESAKKRCNKPEERIKQGKRTKLLFQVRSARERIRSQLRKDDSEKSLIRCLESLERMLYQIKETYKVGKKGKLYKDTFNLYTEIERKIRP